MITLHLTQQEWNAAIELVTAGAKAASTAPQGIILAAGLLIKLQEAAQAQQSTHTNGAATQTESHP